MLFKKLPRRKLKVSLLFLFELRIFFVINSSHHILMNVTAYFQIGISFTSFDFYLSFYLTIRIE